MVVEVRCVAQGKERGSGPMPHLRASGSKVTVVLAGRPPPPGLRFTLPMNPWQEVVAQCSVVFVLGANDGHFQLKTRRSRVGGRRDDGVGTSALCSWRARETQDRRRHGLSWVGKVICTQRSPWRRSLRRTCCGGPCFGCCLSPKKPHCKTPCLRRRISRTWPVVHLGVANATALAPTHLTPS